MLYTFVALFFTYFERIIIKIISFNNNYYYQQLTKAYGTLGQFHYMSKGCHVS